MKPSKKKQLNQAVSDLSLSIDQREYIKSYLGHSKRIRMIQCVIFLTFLGVWEAATRLEWMDAFVFSSPSRVIKSAFFMAKDGSIFYHTCVTLMETFLSFGLVIVLGLFVAIILWWNTTIARVVEPYLVVLNSLPKSALAPVFIVWLGNNYKTIIVAAVSVAVFGSIIALYTDFQSVEEDKIKLIYTLGGRKRDVLLKVVLPSNIPSMISLMKVNIGLSLVGVIIGEFLAANAGLGYLIIYGSQVFKLDWVITSIVILCIVATGLYGMINVIEKKYVK